MNKNIIAAIIIAISGFMIFALVLPQYDALQLVRDAVQQREDLIHKRSDQIAKVKDLIQQYQSRQNDIAKMLVFLPEQSQGDQLVSSIQTATIQNGIQLVSLGIGGGEQASGAAYKITSVDFDGVGGYQSLLSFLKSLESSLRLYDVSQIDLSRNGTTDALSIGMKINAYNLK